MDESLRSRFRGSLASLVAVAVALAFVGSCSKSPASGSDGRYAVGVRTEVFVDRSRPTERNFSAPSQPSRTLVTTVLYPAAGAPHAEDPGEVVNAPPATKGRPFPLVVFSHGFDTTGTTWAFMLRRWVTAGYVVAAPTFPLSSHGAPGGPNLSAFVDQPGDVSFVIDRILDLNHRKGNAFAGLVDPKHIGAAGHSMGAITTLGLTLNTCCRDPRIRAAVPVAGFEGQFPKGRFDHRFRTPLLLMHGDADAQVPHQVSEQLFGATSGPTFLLTIVSGPHAFFGTRAGLLANRAVVDFFDRYLKNRSAGLTRLRRDGRRPGLLTLKERLTQR